MTITVIPSTPVVTGTSGPPVGLTEVDAARITAAIDAGRTESTLAAYSCAWRRWDRWCTSRQIAPFPATPAAVCAYLTECAARGLSHATIEPACAAIGYQHRRQGADNPIQAELVRQVRRGLRRTLGTAPRRRARPLGTAEIRRILARIDRGTAKGARDAALILLGFASALRRSELAALTLADIEAKPAGLLLTVRRSKTDPDVRGQVVGVAPGQHPATDPIAALDAWITIRGSTAGVVFTSLRWSTRGELWFERVVAGAGRCPLVSAGYAPGLGRARSGAVARR
jgi:integrase